MDANIVKLSANNGGMDWVPPTRQTATRESLSLSLSLSFSFEMQVCLIEKRRDRIERISLRGWNRPRTYSEKSRDRPVVKYELGSVPSRASPGYSDLYGGEKRNKGEEILSARREGGPSNRPRETRASGNERIRKYVAAAQHVARNLATSRRGRRLTL